MIKARALLLLVAASMLSLACSELSQLETGDGPASDDAAIGIKKGGVLNFRTTGDMTDWDMAVNGQSAHNADGLRLAYNSLLGFNAQPDPDLNYTQTDLLPELAEKWEITRDATTYIFHLRKGVKWADRAPLRGREFTSADVKWTFEYHSRTGDFEGMVASQNSFMYAGIAGVDAPDKYTIVVRYESGFAPFANYAATKLNPIYPPELYALEGGLSAYILGTGPFQWNEADTQLGSRWVFKKNPTSFQADEVHLDEVRFIVIEDEATAQAAFQTKQIDSYHTSVGQAIADVTRRNPEAISFPYLGGPRYLLMNYERPPLDNPKVRLAISRAIDRDEFVTVIGGRRGWALAGSNMWADLFTQDEIKDIFPHSIEEANKLMEEAGYANGADVSFMYDTGSLLDATLVPLLQVQLKKIGISIVLDGRTRAEVGEDRKRSDFQMHWFGEYPRADPDAQLYGSFVPGQRSNYTNVDFPELTEMIRSQRSEGDPAKRRAILRSAIKHLNENAIGIAIDRTSGAIFWHPHVKNFAPHLDYGTGRSKMLGVWLDK